MARYYFHVLDGTRLIDEQGTELPGIDAAKAEALKLTGVILRDSIHSEIWALQTWTLVVSDGPSPQSGRTYFRLKLTATDGGSA